MVAVFLSEGLQKESKALATAFEDLLGRAGKKKNSVAVLTVSKWMRTEHHTSQSNGDKQSGFGRLVRKKKKAWAKAELESLQRRLFTEKCQRPSFPACTEQAEQSKPLSSSAPHSDSLHINTHTDTSPALLYVTALTTSVKKSPSEHIDWYKAFASDIYSQPCFNLHGLMSDLRQSSNH